MGLAASCLPWQSGGGGSRDRGQRECPALRGGDRGVEAVACCPCRWPGARTRALAAIAQSTRPGPGRYGLRRGRVSLSRRGDGRDPGRAVAQERQTEEAMPELYLSSPQPDRAVLVTPERVAGDRHSLRQSCGFLWYSNANRPYPGAPGFCPFRSDTIPRARATQSANEQVAVHDLGSCGDMEIRLCGPVNPLGGGEKWATSRSRSSVARPPGIDASSVVAFVNSCEQCCARC
jgi:hypothetical protein